MKLSIFAGMAAGALVPAGPQAAMAQEKEPMKPAEWVEVSGIKVDDGYGLKYEKHLATIWRKSQDFALSKGWITGYEVLVNSDPREGEPDVYLLTRFTKWASPDEEKQRAAAFREFMKQTDEQMAAASADRAEYRHLGGQMLLRHMVWND